MHERSRQNQVYHVYVAIEHYLKVKEKKKLFESVCGMLLTADNKIYSIQFMMSRFPSVPGFLM